jgi:uncharacterized membrane protein
MSGWFNINSIVNLQRNLINDISGNTSDGSRRAINSIAGNLTVLNNNISTSSVDSTLTYQNDVNNILEREKERLDERKMAIDQAEQSQKRIIDLTTSATLRNKALNQMYMLFAISLIIYLGIRLLSSFIPDFIASILTTILVAVTLIFLISMYYDYNRRNNMNYNMIDLGEPSALEGGSKTSSEPKSGTNLLSSRFGGCFKESCCPVGSTFNEKYSICIPDKPPYKVNADLNYGDFKYFFNTKEWKNPATCGINGEIYSFEELGCVGNTIAGNSRSGFTTMSTTYDNIKPNGPTEVTDYYLYK